MTRDLLGETLWINGHAVAVTPELLADTLTLIEKQIGVGKIVEQRDIAEAVVQLIHARQAAELSGRRVAAPPITITAITASDPAAVNEPATRRPSRGPR